MIGRIKNDGIKLVRVAWSDPHGVSRAKTVTAEAFLGALKNGYNINVSDNVTLTRRGLASSRPRWRHGVGRDDRLAQMMIIVPASAYVPGLPWNPDLVGFFATTTLVRGGRSYSSPDMQLRKATRSP